MTPSSCVWAAKSGSVNARRCCLLAHPPPFLLVTDAPSPRSQSYKACVARTLLLDPTPSQQTVYTILETAHTVRCATCGGGSSYH